jgi:uncharacterized protein (TIGR00730 family)
VAGSRRRYELRDSELDRLVEELASAAADTFGAAPGDVELAREMLVTSLRFLRDDALTGDLKLVNAAMKELRHAMRVFAPFGETRKVACFGSARTAPDHPDWLQAERFAERMVHAGWMVITGAGEGIMRAAQGGAGRAASFGVNIRLPFEQGANEVIAGDRKLVNFRYFFTRKVMFVKESHAIALFPGGFGTHDEGFEALTLIQTGKSEILPVVFIDQPGGSYWHDWGAYVQSHLRDRDLISEDDLALFKITDDLDEAVAEVTSFYRNYHSSRYVGDRLVIRLRTAPDDDALDALNSDFADMLAGGTIQRSEALPAEGLDAPGLPRLVLRFDRRRAGRMRQLIDVLNRLRGEGAPAQDASPHEIFSVALSEEAEAQESET